MSEPFVILKCVWAARGPHSQTGFERISTNIFE